MKNKNVITPLKVIQKPFAEWNPNERRVFDNYLFNVKEFKTLPQKLVQDISRYIKVIRLE